MYYVDGERGKIQFRNRARQIIDFSGLRFGNITPTDVDGMIEYKNMAFIFYEYKLENCKMPYGQKRAYEALADTLQKGGAQCVVFLCEHSAENPEEDIDAANAKVIATYYCGRWMKRNGTRTVKESTESFIKWITDFSSK